MSEQSKNTKRRLRAQLGPLALSIILALAVVPPAQADSSASLKAALAAVAQGDWGTASAALPAGSVAGDIVEWHRLRAGEGRLGEYEAFLARRPDWPGLPMLKEKGEEAVARSTDPARVLAYFGTGMAETAQGALATIKALRATGREAEAEAEAFRAWADLPFGADQEAELLAMYGPALEGAHAARLDALLWQGRFAEAGRMLTRVDAGRAALAQARIALHNDEDGVNGLIERVPAALQDEPGLAFERFDWRLRRDRTDDAAALILERSTSAQGLGDPDAWGERRAVLVRALLREDKPKLAYRVASSHQMQGGQTYADLEFLSGFIALRRLNDPTTALNHFRALGQAVGTPIPIARAQYWQGRALLAAGDKAAAVQALQTAAQNQTAYYGLLAAEALGMSLDPSLLATHQPGDWNDASFAQSSVLEAALLLDKAGNRTLSKRFFLHLGESLSDADLAKLADLALRIDEPHIAVVIAKAAAERIQRGRGAGEFGAGDQQRVDGAFGVDEGQVGPSEFGVEEFHVEGGVVDDQLGIADKGEEIAGDGGENRLAAQEIIAEAMHVKRLFRHGALGVDVLVIDAAGGQVVVQLDRADFDDAVAFGGLEPGGFGIKDDFAHQRPSRI